MPKIGSFYVAKLAKGMGVTTGSYDTGSQEKRPQNFGIKTKMIAYETRRHRSSETINGKGKQSPFRIFLEIKTGREKMKPNGKVKSKQGDMTC